MKNFRSEEMQLMQLMMPAESAHDTIAALGEVGLLQFKDLNPDKSAFQRTFANQVKRCDDMARKLRFFTDQVDKSGLISGTRLGAEREFDFDELEVKLEELEKELLEVNANAERLARSFSELVELQLVLEKASAFFDDAQHRASASAFETRPADGGPDIGVPLLPEGGAPEPKSMRLGFVAGTIPEDKLNAFERLLFRATRGNMYLKWSSVGSVVDPTTTEKVEKAVFVVFFAGERARSKILKICEAFSANRYPFPDDPTRQRQMNAEVTARLRELQTTIEAGERHRDNVLQTLGATLQAWVNQVKREKAIYHVLNKCSVDVTRKVLVAEAWCPVSAKPRVHEALREAAHSTSASVGTIFQPLVTYEMPPTYFATSKVTSCFQEIVDAYGIARYREANPAIFTIVTFPFLFAVMFGDVGHGFLMLLFALYLVLNEKALGRTTLNEMVEMCFGGRYCILLMSIFSIYTGLIYNEAFAIPLSVFGSGHWACPTNAALTDRVKMHFDESLCPQAYSEGLAMNSKSPYAFGVDPTWKGTRTELQFLNSVKMKISILLGVIQMNGGIVLSYLNQRYFRDSLSTYCEFIPQMIFLNGLFGYLCLLIVGKWVSGSTADLYHVMIYMFLSPGTGGLACLDATGKYGCPENIMFTGQGPLQVFLVLIALVSVPIMLLPKPLILQKRFKARAAQLEEYGRVSPHDEDEEAGVLRMAAPAHDHEEEFDFGEVMVHQMIHTIEFVLGAVSNTASYLRLWALSLAHSQLSAVFYDRVLMTAIKANSWIAVFIGFFVFALATLGVLMLMETLSAFLHALRLHWVEFQNKFYHGDGYKFMPFSFESVLAEDL
ncbi:g11684 [Coccomyxa elongata]